MKVIKMKFFLIAIVIFSRPASIFGCPSLIQGSVNDACSLSTQEFLNNAPEYRTHFNNEQQKIEDFNSQYMKCTKALRRRVNHLSKISNSRNDEFIQEPYAIFRGIPGDDNGYMSYFWAYSAIPAPDFDSTELGQQRKILWDLLEELRGHLMRRLYKEDIAGDMSAYAIWVSKSCNRLNPQKFPKISFRVNIYDIGS